MTNRGDNYIYIRFPFGFLLSYIDGQALSYMCLALFYLYGSIKKTVDYPTYRAACCMYYSKIMLLYI